MKDRILKYWPLFYHNVRDFEALAETLGVEFEDLQNEMDNLLDDNFVLTSREEAIKRRERMLKIQPDPNVEPIDFRKQRIINRYSTKPPFTIRYLQQRLDALVGPGLTVADVDHAQYLLTITAAIENANLFKEVEHLFRS